MIDESPTGDYYYDVEYAAECIEEEVPEDPNSDDIYTAIHDTLDTDIGMQSTDHAIHVLGESDRHPDNWQIYVRDQNDFADVIRAMARSVYRQDLRNELEALGVLG
jgi:hypothetical protein